ncbi:MAG TPA: NAD(P)-dependent oxidoreductase [Ktedonobacteraceae bacterium]|jgi:D-lactate dehydrogenase|nr:NAD(P)-dependent oxidoreductase [Ktedonobacteraceae bacterium]
MQPPLCILIPDVNEEEGNYLSKALSEQGQVIIQSGGLYTSDAHLLEKVAILLPFIHNHIGSAEMDTMPHLKLIATRSSGYDHIDLIAAKMRGITVANVPGYGEIAVAEHSFALMLALTRKIYEAVGRVKRGDYNLEGLRGFDLYGKTLGVVGAGAIGLHVIRIARGFGMHVLAYDVTQNRLLSEVLGFRYASLDEVLKQADIVSLHAPALASTYHMINRERLAHMKQGALLINTARGALIDTVALLWALKEGALGGAGLDTLEGEELWQGEKEEHELVLNAEQRQLLEINHALRAHENVLVTAHTAFNTREAAMRILDITIENVQDFLHGELKNQVRS